MIHGVGLPLTHLALDVDETNISRLSPRVRSLCKHQIGDRCQDALSKPDTT